MGWWHFPRSARSAAGDGVSDPANVASGKVDLQPFVHVNNGCLSQVKDMLLLLLDDEDVKVVWKVLEPSVGRSLPHATTPAQIASL